MLLDPISEAACRAVLLWGKVRGGRSEAVGRAGLELPVGYTSLAYVLSSLTESYSFPK